MKVTPTAIGDVKRIEPEVLTDARGSFRENWRARELAAAGIESSFVQENSSVSGRGVLRGLHYQVAQPQGKLISVSRGEIFDVAVDLRRRSPSLGRWVGVTLSGDSGSLLWIPPGFAHGYYVTSECAEVVYRCTNYYSPRHERTIRWDDRALAVEWPIAPETQPILSDKDRSGGSFAAAELYECAF